METNRLQTICFKIINWSLVAILFFIPLYFAWFHENYTVFDLNKSVALRFLLIIALSTFLIYVSATGKIPYFKSKKIIIAWLAVVGLVITSTFLSLHPMISLLGSYERQQGLHNILPYLLFFIFLITFLRERRQFERLLVVFQISAAIICLYGLLQVLGLDPLRWSESSSFRIFSSFGQPNFFGHYLAVMIPLTLYSLFFIGKKYISRLLFALLVVAEIICLIFTYSRSAWLALVVAFILAVIIILWHYRKRRLSIGLSIFVVIGFIALTLSPVRSFVTSYAELDNLNIVNRAVSILNTNAGSTVTRLKYWSATLKALREAPLKRQLFGFGPDVQTDIFVRQYQIDWGYYERLNAFPDRAHNAPLDLLLQFGLLGLAAFSSLIIFSLWPLIRRLFKTQGKNFWLCLALAMSLVAYGVNNLFSFSLTAMAAIFFWLLASAYVVGSDFLPIKEKTLSFFQPVSRWLISGGLIILLLILFFGYNIRPLVADYYYVQVKKAEVRQDCRTTLDDMEKVMTWYPISHYYARAYLHHNINCFSAVNSAESKEQIINNILEQTNNLPLEENQFYTLIDLAHTYSILGHYADQKYYVLAEGYYQELLKINPLITHVYQDYGRMKLWQTKFSEARQIFEQGLTVTPSLANAPAEKGHIQAISWQTAYFYDLIGLSYNNEHNIEQAEIAYKTAIEINPQLTSPYKELADIAYRKGDLETAIKYNKEAFIFEPQNILWPVNLATLYLEKEDLISARHYAEITQGLDPDDQKVQDLMNLLDNKQ